MWAASQRWIAVSVAACALVALSGCFSLGARSKPEADPKAASAVEVVEEPVAPAMVIEPVTRADVVLDFVLADDLENRLLAAARLCDMQRPFLARAHASPMEKQAADWLEDRFQARAAGTAHIAGLGPRTGLADLHRSRGYELYVEADGGLVIFSREGSLIGRVAEEDRALADLAFHDVDADGQQELFLKFDSRSNSGNRFTEIRGYKERDGALELVLSRKLYETAYRWVSAGLGSRLTVVELAGAPYVVVDPEGETEFLRWDAARSAFVTESAPARRAFLP